MWWEKKTSLHQVTNKSRHKIRNWFHYVERPELLGGVGELQLGGDVPHHAVWQHRSHLRRGSDVSEQPQHQVQSGNIGWPDNKVSGNNIRRIKISIYWFISEFLSYVNSSLVFRVYPLLTTTRRVTTTKSTSRLPRARTSPWARRCTVWKFSSSQTMTRPGRLYWKNGQTLRW